MKSERRHELQHNALADWIINGYEQIKPFQNAILGVFLLLAVGYLAFTWWTRQSAARAAEAWLAMAKAEPLASPGFPNEAEVDRVIQQFPGTSAAQWAKITSADNDLASGASMLFTNKAAANEQLTRAADRYEEVLKSSPTPMTRQRAMFWLARAQECQGKLSDASRTYQQVASDWPSGTFAHAASERVADLKKPDTKWFYDQFAAFNPKPAKDLLPDSKSLTLPENPPEEPATKKDGKNAEKPAAKTTEKSAEKPAEKSAAEKPEAKPAEKASEKPADKATEKPADKAMEKPADKAMEKPADKAVDKPADKPATPTTPEKAK